jgi:hypothetical protein
MSIYWLIYLSGVVFCLYWMTADYIDWCVKRKIDYRKEFRDLELPFNIAICSLGSWLMVLFLYWTKRKS